MWLAHSHYFQLDLVTGDHQNPEGRIGEDARIATDAPVDFVVGILNATVTAVTFGVVLWIVGGDLTLGTPAAPIVIPGFLVIAADHLRGHHQHGGHAGREPLRHRL